MIDSLSSFTDLIALFLVPLLLATDFSSSSCVQSTCTEQSEEHSEIQLSSGVKEKLLLHSHTHTHTMASSSILV